MIRKGSLLVDMSTAGHVVGNNAASARSQLHRAILYLRTRYTARISQFVLEVPTIPFLSIKHYFEAFHKLLRLITDYFDELAGFSFLQISSTEYIGLKLLWHAFPT